ncbi:MAG: flagellar biosynthesis repressor FlbT [Rickettsiales bacterium]|nr:flagellar biosynthesis repressor FlbT [Rickettsiales bacterium]|tara:strand:- start:618 stop:1049 length:432 start_codon:yes stop_codon:yes gene_type:complete
MGLIIDLKANEKVIVGDAVISAGDSRTKISIQGSAPIIREKDVMTVERADTACKKLYLLVQLMYLEKEPDPYFDDYFALVNEIQEAAPSTTLFFLNISEKILEGNLYKALKEAKKLVDFETALISHEMGLLTPSTTAPVEQRA